MSVDEQYAEIEPDVVVTVLKERGWKHDADLSTLDADCYKKGFFRIYILDGNQRGALSAMFDYEGPEAVAEVWRRSL